MALSFVLSGGGLKGSFQAGALKKLDEKGVLCEHIYGVSTGAINTFGYAFGDGTKLVEMWKGIQKRSDLMGVEWWKLLWAKGIYNLKPLESWMYGYAYNKVARCKATVSYVELDTGKIKYVSADQGLDAFIHAVLASASQPPVVVPLQGNLVDGGVREQTPLARAIDEGATKIFVLLTNPATENITSTFEWKVPYIYSYVSRATDILEHANFVNDIRFCQKLNDCADAMKLTKVDLRVISPDREMLGTFEVAPEKILASIELGYSEADKLLVEPMVEPVPPPANGT